MFTLCCQSITSGSKMRNFSVVGLECAQASSGEHSPASDLHKGTQPIRAPRSASSAEIAECKVRVSCQSRRRSDGADFHWLRRWWVRRCVLRVQLRSERGKSILLGRRASRIRALADRFTSWRRHAAGISGRLEIAQGRVTSQWYMNQIVDKTASQSFTAQRSVHNIGQRPKYLY